jgi:hypothetical protein
VITEYTNWLSEDALDELAPARISNIPQDYFGDVVDKARFTPIERWLEQ